VHTGRFAFEGRCATVGATVRAPSRGYQVSIPWCPRDGGTSTHRLPRRRHPGLVPRSDYRSADADARRRMMPAAFGEYPRCDALA